MHSSGGRVIARTTGLSDTLTAGPVGPVRVRSQESNLFASTALP